MFLLVSVQMKLEFFFSSFFFENRPSFSSFGF